MKYSRYEQVRIVTADSFAEMEQKFNETMIELSHYRPHREILAPNAWAIFYTEEVETAETISERHELEHTEIQCRNCEYYELILNKNGTENRATKHAKCKLWGCTILKKDVAKDMCYEKFEQKGGQDVSN